MLSIFPQFLDFQFYGPLFLRVALGIIFIAHGWKKISGGKESRAQFAGWLGAMKIRPGKFWALVVTLVEFFGGVLLFVGFFVQPIALVLSIQFLVILFWVRRGQPFIAKPDAPMMSWEFDFLIFFALVALLVLGPGACAIDLPL